MDRITNSLLKDFVEKHEIQSNDESKNFEHFCNHTIITTQYNKTFDFNDISTGEGGDTGIDGIGIIVNGNLVNNEDDIDTLLNNSASLDVNFIFIQSKTSSNFDGGDILRFHHGVLDFLNENTPLSRNEEITKFYELTNKIFDNAPKFINNPSIKVFYVTTGTKQDNNDMTNIINTHGQALAELNLFEKIEVGLLGADEIVKLYRKAQSKISSNFIFSTKITLPPIRGVDQAYYGIVPFKEFKKILIDDNDHLLNMFYDNVRDYQGDKNNVNSGISETLKSDNPDLFSVLNNGITVVADSAKPTGNSIKITDYQIVNGCQTSNVLFENRHREDIEEMQIPLRLIVTQDPDVKASITISTNSQTAIKKEQLSAMSDFQKGLEDYYNARLGEQGLYYERRAKQYASDTKVTRTRIITIANQVKSYSSMFRQDPYLVTTYFGKLAKSIGEPNSQLCESGHKYAPYYMAGLAYYKLDSLFRDKDIDAKFKIDTKFKKVRFHVLMLMLMIATDKPNPPMNSERKTEEFCEPIIKKLLDDKTCLKIFKKATEIIERSKVDLDDKQKLKLKSITTQIIKAFKTTDRI